MIKTIVASLLALLLAVPAYAFDGARILEQVDRGLNPESYEMYRKLINVEPSGAKKEFTLYHDAYMNSTSIMSWMRMTD